LNSGSITFDTNYGDLYDIGSGLGKRSES